MTVIVPARHWVEKTVAVVAPLSDAATKARLERTAQWLLDNLSEAQRYDTLAIELKLEWYDEQTADLSTLSTTLARRDDIVAIVGPFGNDAVDTFAAACKKTKKPLIAPTATSEELVRRYAVETNNGTKEAQPFLWPLTKTDVEMTETMMSTFAAFCSYHGYQDVTAHFISPDDVYGQTFNYWAPFFAENYQISTASNIQYSHSDGLRAALEKTHGSVREFGEKLVSTCTFAVVEHIQQLYQAALIKRELVCKDQPELFYPDPDDPRNEELLNLVIPLFNARFVLNDLSEEGLEALGEKGAKILQGYQGFSPYADPTTGFEQSYLQRYGVMPTFSECKLYDGLLLSAFAACYAGHHPGVAIGDAIMTITSVNTGEYVSGAVWNAPAMEVYLTNMERGRLMQFKGASGAIGFDKEHRTAAYTTYVHWQIMEGKIQHLAYLGDSGSRRVENPLAAWAYLYDKERAERDFEQQNKPGAAISYPALTDQYAVLVQGSYEATNQRHMGDVMMMYQLLRKGGVPDDHIILVVDKAWAADKKYVIRAGADGPDLMGGTDQLPAAVIDYDNADLSATDISNILLGIETSRTPTVLPRDAGQNVLFFWSGHGSSNAFIWRDDAFFNGFSYDLMQRTAQTMLSSDAPTCRKLLVVAEPCYGESVISALDGIDGALGISGANRYEQSWGDNWSATEGYLCDRFSLNFYNCLSDNPQTTYHDLFLYLAEHTIASHARIVNASHFGNLSASNASEFITYSIK